MQENKDLQLPTVVRKKLPPHLEKIKNGVYTIEDPDYPVHKYLKGNTLSIDENGSEIIKFLKGKSILITGATGFLGKLLVEKLLRSCKNIEKIYLIIRSKKGQTIESRIKEYLDNYIFIKLSEVCPNFREKIIGINGDLEQFGLDLSKESRKLITDKVNIIYHVAATVRFDEALRVAVMININGTREIIQIAKECKNLSVLCHVSTAFSNCNRNYTEEKFYEPFVNSSDLLQITEKLSDKTLEKIQSRLIGDMPNTYAFTKQIAEHLIQQEAIGIPICVVRPAIVLATAKEPIPSWTDNFYGIVGMTISLCLGYGHIIPVRSDAIVNFVPADYVVNHCIAASYKTASDKAKDKIPIYNLALSENNPITWGAYKNILEKFGRRISSTKMMFLPFTTCTNYISLFLFLNFLFHYMPARIADWIFIFAGKTPRFMKMYSKIGQFRGMLAYFTLNEWTFDVTNTNFLWDSLNEKDKKNFCFDMKTLNWVEYAMLVLIGNREYLLKEYLDNLEEGRKHYRKVKILSILLIILIAVLPTYFLINTIFCFIPITILAIIMYYLLCYYVLDPY